VKAQAAMEGARKDKNNPHFKTAYADIAAVWDAIREPLTANGLAIVQFPRTMQNGVEVETTLLHTSGEFMSDVLWLPAQMTAQGVGSALTYARRYALMAVAGVAPVDDDGNAATGQPAGMAGGGTDFRPAGPRRQSSWGPGGKAQAIADAERDGLIDHTRKKGELPKKPGALTPEEERAAKIRDATDKRIAALKARTDWTRPELDKFWSDDKKWIDWMADPTNEALKEYERFTDAFAEAEMNMKEVA
jgi:hypothetical protein